jgi:hypothetical protein
MLKEYILPEFNSKEPFMRLRACKAYGKTADVEFTTRDHARIAVIGLHKCLFDSYLPIRVEATISLAKLCL